MITNSNLLKSPPCQPYTRQKQGMLGVVWCMGFDVYTALKQGSKDPRAKSFLHLLELLPTLNHPPSYLLMENVVGFEVCNTYNRCIMN